MQQKHPQCLFLMGLPGSGKSTHLQSFQLQFREFIYSTDNLIEQWAASSGTTYDAIFKESIKPATAQMNKELADAISFKKNIVWDQTLMSVKSRAKALRHFQGTNYKLGCICFVPPVLRADLDEHTRRLQSRPGKTIPMHVIDQMRISYQPPHMDEGFTAIKFLNIWGDNAFPTISAA